MKMLWMSFQLVLVLILHQCPILYKKGFSTRFNESIGHVLSFYTPTKTPKKQALSRH